MIETDEILVIEITQLVHENLGEKGERECDHNEVELGIFLAEELCGVLEERLLVVMGLLRDLILHGVVLRVDIRVRKHEESIVVGLLIGGLFLCIHQFVYFEFAN